MTAPQSRTTYLNVKDLNKSFVINQQSVLVLDNINLAIQEGEFISIVGSSGCGKSTLLRIIAGLEIEYDGLVTLNDKKIVRAGLDRGIVFQEHRLFPWLSVKDNIAYALKNMPKQEKEKIIAEHIELVGLQGFENAYPSQLSGGMAQRASIARALVNHPRVLLLDEPFGALDAFTKMQLQNEIKRIRAKEKTTMILVTHDIDEAIFLGDWVVVMTARPGAIKKIFPIDNGIGNDRGSAEFAHTRRAVYHEFFEEKSLLPEYVI